MMRSILFFSMLATGVLLLLTSCDHDAPPSPFKPLEQRTILLLTSEGHIYDQAGRRVMELPNCVEASEIISDGNDYFVSGKTTKEQVGYWKNGKWNTLHVDFIDDVEHWTDGIGKWDYYIYLFDYPHILKNSGIFPLEDSEDFTPASKCMSVSEGKCYVVGRDHPLDDDEYQNAVIYYEHKGKYAKEILPKPREDMNSAAFTVFAYEGTHTIVGGRVGEEACLWIDKQLQMLPRIYDDVHDKTGMGFPVASVSSVTRVNGHIYAVGSENNQEGNEVATVWIDGVPQHLLTGQEGLFWSWIVETIGYDDDWYALSIEMAKLPNGDTDVYFVMWLNGQEIGRYRNIDLVNFTVI